MTDIKKTKSTALDAWSEWWQREKAKGNTRTIGEVMRDRHGQDCKCGDGCRKP